MKEPLQATRTPLPFIEPHGVIDLKEFFNEEDQRREDEEQSKEIRKSIEEEEAR